jgi:hypothetical protein
LLLALLRSTSPRLAVRPSGETAHIYVGEVLDSIFRGWLEISEFDINFRVALLAFDPGFGIGER